MFYTDIDEIDRKIIRLLQENGRRTNADIARSIKMSEATVKNRIDKLIENGIVRVLAVLNPKTLGFLANALLGIRVLPGNLEKVGDSLASINEVVYLGYVTGRYDILIEVLLRDPDEFFDFISNHVHKISGIVSTETFYIMRTQKINYEWKLSSEVLKKEPNE